VARTLASGNKRKYRHRVRVGDMVKLRRLSIQTQRELVAIGDVGSAAIGAGIPFWPVMGLPGGSISRTSTWVVRDNGRIGCANSALAAAVIGVIVRVDQVPTGSFVRLAIAALSLGAIGANCAPHDDAVLATHRHIAASTFQHIKPWQDQWS